MKSLLVALILLVVNPSPCLADGWGGGLMDYLGNGITSTTSSSKQPLDIGITVSGSIVDPRTRTWTLSSGTDSCSAVESGTWNVGLSTGSNLVGKVGIDQTTPGTTNGVQVNAALPTGTNSIGQITANAGTNLNTSALNLETTQSGFKSANHTDLTLIDTDLLAFKTANHADLIATEPRNTAQVNGVTVLTSTGASGTGTQRVTLAADGQKTMTNSTAMTLASDQSGINTFLDKSGSGTISALNGTVTATCNGSSAVVFSVSGTFTATYFFKGINQDGSESYLYADSVAFGSDTMAQNFSLSPGAFVVDCAGFSTIKLKAEAYTLGTINVGWNSSAGTKIVKVYQPNAANLNATVVQGSANTIANAWPVKVTDGTNSMPTGDVASRKIFTAITDGTNTQTVKAASTAAASTDSAAVVVLSSNFPVLTGTTGTAVSVGTGSTATVASNANRAGLILVNTSIQRMSCTVGTAVLNSGVSIFPGGTWTMDQYSFTTAAINCIAGAAASNMSVQEFTK